MQQHNVGNRVAPADLMGQQQQNRQAPHSYHDSLSVSVVVVEDDLVS